MTHRGSRKRVRASICEITIKCTSSPLHSAKEVGKFAPERGSPPNTATKYEWWQTNQLSKCQLSLISHVNTHILKTAFSIYGCDYDLYSISHPALLPNPKNCPWIQDQNQIRHLLDPSSKQIENRKQKETAILTSSITSLSHEPQDSALIYWILICSSQLAQLLPTLLIIVLKVTFNSLLMS